MYYVRRIKYAVYTPYKYVDPCNCPTLVKTFESLPSDTWTHVHLESGAAFYLNGTGIVMGSVLAAGTVGGAVKPTSAGAYLGFRVILGQTSRFFIQAYVEAENSPKP